MQKNRYCNSFFFFPIDLHHHQNTCTLPNLPQSSTPPIYHRSHRKHTKTAAKQLRSLQLDSPESARFASHYRHWPFLSGQFLPSFTVMFIKNRSKLPSPFHFNFSVNLQLFESIHHTIILTDLKSSRYTHPCPISRSLPPVILYFTYLQVLPNTFF